MLLAVCLAQGAAFLLVLTCCTGAAWSEGAMGVWWVWPSQHRPLWTCLKIEVRRLGES